MINRESGLFERYAELGEIGAGGMARVILAHDRLLDRRVALKLLRAGEPDLMRRLVNEGRLTARCRHDNVIAIHEVGHQNTCPYLVLEYLSGKSLSALLDAAWRLPYARAIALFLPVLQALEHIHNRGVVHCDLKPDNIFLVESGAAKLIDFGIATLRSDADHRAARTQHARESMLVGTYEYMSPEQWNCGSIDHLADIWACGLVLYRMICGCLPLHPWIGTQLMVTASADHAMPSMAAYAPPDVPQQLIGIIDRCLYKRKEWRWQSAAVLLAALAPFVDEQAQAAVSQSSEVHTVILDRGSLGWGTPAQGTREELPPAAVPLEDDVTPIDTVTIVFLAADPTGTDKSMLGRQAHDIQAELDRSTWRDSIELVTSWAPEPVDLLRALHDHPTVVHFAGSCEEATERRWGQSLLGDRKNGLFLRGRDGRPRLVAPTALDQTFGAAGRSVRAVVMSSCFTELHADALLLHVDCVVGMPAIHPDAAKAYAVGFYGAIGQRRAVGWAHKHGCAAVALEGYETSAFRIKTRAGVDADSLFLPLD